LVKEEYIDSHIITLLHQWTSAATKIGSVIIIFLGLLDYLVTPENFQTFFIYRVVAATLIIIIYLYNKQKVDRNRHNVITILTSIIVSGMVAFMIAKFGGHQSPYFGGIILTVIFIVGMAPLNINMCIIASAIIYAIYLVPILSYDTITNMPFFISSNAFILAAIFGIILYRYLIHQRFVSEFGLQYDTIQQKEQLRIYSTQLEELVAERTKELAISEQRYRELFDSANDGIVVFNEHGKVFDVNREFCEMYGFDKGALIGVDMKKLELMKNHAERNERMKRILSGESLVFEAEHHKENGDRLIVEVSSKAIKIREKIYVQSFFKDITDKKRLLAQLFQSQKMESIGVLAGGIAHDFNNYLLVILGHAELLGVNDQLDATSRNGIKMIESSARKAGQIVSKLLSFARQGKFVPLPLNFSDVLKDAVELLERSVAKKQVVLKIETDNQVLVTKGDCTQLEQVIMNLVMNAVDAMPGGGTITLSTSLVHIGRNEVRIHPLLSSGNYVCLKVKDTGSGIPDEIRDRIFDPFFTTKGPEKGTGLGLAIIYGIVKEHNGVITVTSSLGRGTTFEVYLPTIEPGFFAELN
jgi:PAS domain S-box-containing protein